MIEDYTANYKEGVIQLIDKDEYVRDDILNLLYKWSECALVTRINNKIIAIAVFTGYNFKTSATLYVKESERGKGLGKDILKKLEEKMILGGVKEVIIDYKVNNRIKGFLYKNGYNHWFYSNLMVYSNSKVKDSNYNMIPYDDKYYNQCQRILNEGFHRMRGELGLKSKLALPNNEEREEYKEEANNIFLLEDNEEIVAAIILVNNEIDGVAVDENKTKRGYGTALVGKAINKLLEEGHKEVILWVIEGNNAKSVYGNIGFKVIRVHEFVNKHIYN